MFYYFKPFHSTLLTIYVYAKPDAVVFVRHKHKIFFFSADILVRACLFEGLSIYFFPKEG